MREEASSVSPYRIELLSETGELREVRTEMHPHDDAAIDRAGRIGHPHEINVWQGDRHVARFPPVPFQRR
jgi:hypothetical protein